MFYRDERIDLEELGCNTVSGVCSHSSRRVLCQSSKSLLCLLVITVQHKQGKVKEFVMLLNKEADRTLSHLPLRINMIILSMQLSAVY